MVTVLVEDPSKFYGATQGLALVGSADRTPGSVPGAVRDVVPIPSSLAGAAGRGIMGTPSSSIFKLPCFDFCSMIPVTTRLTANHGQSRRPRERSRLYENEVSIFAIV